MVSTAELLGPPIHTVGLITYFAACLRDTNPNGNVGRQTDTLGWLSKLNLHEENMPFYYDVLKT